MFDVGGQRNVQGGINKHPDQLFPQKNDCIGGASVFPPGGIFFSFTRLPSKSERRKKNLVRLRANYYLIVMFSFFSSNHSHVIILY